MNICHDPIMNNPYELLQVSTDASSKQITKAFHKQQLKYHPDRKDGNADMYMKIVAAYKAIKSKSAFVDIYNNFKNSYVDSEEEYNDIIMLYKKYKGSMRKIIDNHLLCENHDEERIRIIIEKFIDEKKVKRFAEFKKKLRCNKKIQKKVDINELASLLQKNEEKRKTFIKDLEEKYSNQLGQ